MKHICFKALLAAQMPPRHVPTGQRIGRWKMEDGFADFEQRNAHVVAIGNYLLCGGRSACSAGNPAKSHACSDQSFSPR
jgi:hypothetical protein